MQLALWWMWTRILWAIRPLPRDSNERDRLLADRAALVLDRHLRRVTSTYRLDPYATRAPKWSAENPSDERLIQIAIERTKRVLRSHSMAGYLLNALLRDRDPPTVAESRRVAEEVAREAAEEKERRSSPTIPPPAASGSNIPIGGKSGTP